MSDESQLCVYCPESVTYHISIDLFCCTGARHASGHRVVEFTVEDVGFVKVSTDCCKTGASEQFRAGYQHAIASSTDASSLLQSVKPDNAVDLAGLYSQSMLKAGYLATILAYDMLATQPVLVVYNCRTLHTPVLSSQDV